MVYSYNLNNLNNLNSIYINNIDNLNYNLNLTSRGSDMKQPVSRAQFDKLQNQMIVMKRFIESLLRNVYSDATASRFNAQLDFFVGNQPLTPDEVVAARQQPKTWQDEVREDRLAEQMLENLRDNVGEQPINIEKCKTCGKGIGGVCGACHCYCPSVQILDHQSSCALDMNHTGVCKDSGGNWL